jgi:hypothetical protein
MEDRMSATDHAKQTGNASGNGSAESAQGSVATSSQPVSDQMAALGELICRLNPYTEVPYDKDTNMGTGPMEVETLPKPSNVPGDGNGTIVCMNIEAERNYNTTWTFKGQPQNVKAAFRIPYRFQVQDKDENVKYWQTEYLLIGYAGGDGPG